MPQHELLLGRSAAQHLWKDSHNAARLGLHAIVAQLQS